MHLSGYSLNLQIAERDIDCHEGRGWILDDIVPKMHSYHHIECPHWCYRSGLHAFEQHYLEAIQGPPQSRGFGWRFLQHHYLHSGQDG